MEEIKNLLGIAQDEERSGQERLEAFQQADEQRKAAKTGWSKLGMTAEQVDALRTELTELAQMDAEDQGAAEAQVRGTPVEGAQTDEFEATDAELAAQAGRASNKGAQDAAEDEAAAARVKAEAKVKASKGADGEPRGGLTRLVESLLMDANLSYLDIINAVLKEYPGANTTARSIASVAAGMRKKGKDVPMRKRVAAPKPAKAEPAAEPTGEQEEEAKTDA